MRGGLLRDLKPNSESFSLGQDQVKPNPFCKPKGLDINMIIITGVNVISSIGNTHGKSIMFKGRNGGYFWGDFHWELGWEYKITPKPFLLPLLFSLNFYWASHYHTWLQTWHWAMPSWQELTITHYPVRPFLLHHTPCRAPPHPNARFVKGAAGRNVAPLHSPKARALLCACVGQPQPVTSFH